MSYQTSIILHFSICKMEKIKHSRKWKVDSLSLTLPWFNGLNSYLGQSAEKGISWQKNQSTLAITKLTPSFYENVGCQTFGTLTIFQPILYYS